MAFTKHNNYPEIPIGAVEWPALYNDSIHKMDVGRTIKVVVGEAGGLTKGTPFYIQSDGKAYLALSTTTQLGLWQTTSTAQNIEGYGQVSGIIETGTWAAGDTVYVSATGTLTTVSPGATAAPIAYAISTTELNLVRLTYQDMVNPETFNAHTILKADVDNTPLALTVPEQTLVGRITAGNITALTKAQVLTLLGLSDALNYKGTIDASTNPNYPAADAGDYYKISVAGRIGGASGEIVEAGDAIICNVDGSPAGDQATVGGNWNVLQTNIDLANPGPIGGTTPAIGNFTGLDFTSSTTPVNTLADITSPGADIEDAVLKRALINEVFSPWVVAGLTATVTGTDSNVTIAPGTAYNTQRLHTTGNTVLVVTNTGAIHTEYVSVNTTGDLIITTAARASNELAVADVDVDAAGVATAVIDVRQLDLILRTSNAERVVIDKGGNVKITTIKSGSTQAAAGAAVNELWKTLGHATLPDNVVLIGV